MFNNQDFKNNPKPLFENDFNFSNPFDQTMSQNSIGTFEDTPPQLGPISNLNGIKQIDGPTGDVLSPMNIMPETFEKKDDALFEYDNGNINLNGSSNIFASNDINTFNSLENNLSYNPENKLYNSSTFDISTNNVNYDNMLISNPSEIIPDNSIAIANEKEESYIIDNSSININDNKLTDIESDSVNILSEINNNSILNVADEQEMSDAKEEYEIVQDKSLEEESSIGYEIIQDKQVKESNNLIDLGIDHIYAEEDTIDIVDFDEDNDMVIEKKETSIKEESEPIKNNVKKIKEYISRLKEEGLNVEIEEFDFEHMYQLIVKIDK